MAIHHDMTTADFHPVKLHPVQRRLLFPKYFFASEQTLCLFEHNNNVIQKGQQYVIEI